MAFAILRDASGSRDVVTKSAMQYTALPADTKLTRLSSWDSNFRVPDEESQPLRARVTLSCRFFWMFFNYIHSTGHSYWNKCLFRKDGDHTWTASTSYHVRTTFKPGHCLCLARAPGCYMVERSVLTKPSSSIAWRRLQLFRSVCYRAERLITLGKFLTLSQARYDKSTRKRLNALTVPASGK